MFDRFGIDLGTLEAGLISKKAYPLSAVSDRIEKVAFDVVRFQDDDGNTSLWQVQDSNNGPVIVALYDDPDEMRAESSWEAIPDKHANIHIYNKGEPIARFACAKIGVETSEINTACRWLPEKLADDSFREKLFKHIGVLNGEING